MKRTYSTFSEQALEILDFARCQRTDGSYYGTSGQCRKGKEVGPKEIKALQAKAQAGDAKAKATLEKLSKVEDPDSPKGPVAPKPSAEPKPQAKVQKIEDAKPPEPEKKKELSERSKEALRLVDEAEKRAKEELEKAQADVKRLGEFDSGYDDAVDRTFEAKGALKRIEADRQAVSSGALDAPPPTPLTASQRERIDQKYNELTEKFKSGTATRADETLFGRLKEMRDADDPKAMAIALKERMDARKALDKVGWDGPPEERKAAAARVDAANRAIESARTSPLKRLGAYVMSDGTVKLMKSDSDDKQNAAHKDSTALFKENGVLGDSKQAAALVAKYGGDRAAVQKGIDDIVSFTQNDYRAIRKAVDGTAPNAEYAARAESINRMLKNMDHPDVTKYRGINVPEASLDQMISAAQAKSSFSDPGPASWSTSGKISLDYTGSASPGRAQVLFETRNKQGASVENWGQSGEKELLTPGGTSYKYTGYRIETFQGQPVHVFTVDES